MLVNGDSKTCKIELSKNKFEKLCKEKHTGYELFATKELAEQASCELSKKANK